MSPASSVTVDLGKKVSIAPLREDQANWPTYREDFVNALKARGLEKYLSGNFVRPTRFEYDDSADKYWKLDKDGNRTTTELTAEEADKAETRASKYDEAIAQIQELLRGTTTTAMWLQIRTAGTPKAMWEALKKKCTEKHVSTVENVRDAMRKVRCAEGEDPHTAIEQLLNYREQLAEMGRELDADDIVECIRLAFPHFRPALDILESNVNFARKRESDPSKRADIFVTSDEAFEVVQEAWQRQRDDRASDETAGHTALGANTKKKGAAKKPAKSQGSAAAAETKCYTCGGLGHFQRDCPSAPRDDDKPPSRRGRFGR